MSQFRSTPDGTIDYNFYKKEAGRLRREARNRFVGGIAAFAILAVCFPFRQIRRFAHAWQSAWPAAVASETGKARAAPSLAKVRSLFW